MNMYFDKDKAGRDILVMEDAKIFWTNFSGRPDKFNKQGGKRHFCLELPHDVPLIEDMMADGWNVKWTKPNNEEYEPAPYIDVNISWAFKAPLVTFITSGGETDVTEDIVGQIDTAEITRIDMALDLSYSKRDDGGRRIKGYVKTMDVYLYEDPIRRRRYERMRNAEEGLPFGE